MAEIADALPFPLQGLDSDNGSEFINRHLFWYCQDHKIQFTRGRPYQKDHNAQIEQKNWTQVRKLLGWDRAAPSNTTTTLTTPPRPWRRSTLFQLETQLETVTSTAMSSGSG